MYILKKQETYALCRFGHRSMRFDLQKYSLTPTIKDKNGDLRYPIKDPQHSNEVWYVAKTDLIQPKKKTIKEIL